MSEYIIILLAGLCFGIQIGAWIKQWSIKSDIAYDYETKKHFKMGNRIYKIDSFEELL